MLTFAAMSPLLSAEELESLHPVSGICQKKIRSGETSSEKSGDFPVVVFESSLVTSPMDRLF
jgi:hypothetical protein